MKFSGYFFKFIVFFLDNVCDCFPYLSLKKMRFVIDHNNWRIRKILNKVTGDLWIRFISVTKSSKYIGFPTTIVTFLFINGLNFKNFKDNLFSNDIYSKLSYQTYREFYSAIYHPFLFCF